MCVYVGRIRCDGGEGGRELKSRRCGLPVCARRLSARREISAAARCARAAAPSRRPVLPPLSSTYGTPAASLRIRHNALHHLRPLKPATHAQARGKAGAHLDISSRDPALFLLLCRLLRRLLRLLHDGQRARQQRANVCMYRVVRQSACVSDLSLPPRILRRRRRRATRARRHRATALPQRGSPSQAARRSPRRPITRISLT